MINNWNNLPLGEYLEILKVAADEQTEDIEKQVSYIAILADMSEEDVLAMAIAEYTKLAEQMQFLLEPAPDYKGKITDRINIGQNRYRLTTDYRQITTAQYIDFNHYARTAKDNIVELISVFLIPDGKSYNNGYDILDVQRDIRDGLNVPLANAMVAFFLSRLRISIKATLISLAWMAKWSKHRRKMLKRVMEQVQMVLAKNGTGLYR